MLFLRSSGHRRQMLLLGSAGSASPGISEAFSLPLRSDPGVPPVSPLSSVGLAEPQTACCASHHLHATSLWMEQGVEP